MPAHIQAMIDAIDWNDPKYRSVKTRTLVRKDIQLRGGRPPRAPLNPDILADMYYRKTVHHMSHKSIADYLNERGIQTLTGVPWTAVNVSAAMATYARSLSGPQAS